MNVIKQYKILLSLVEEFERWQEKQLYLTLYKKPTLDEQHQENHYWNVFYVKFCDFMYDHKKYYDGYAEMVFKRIKTFLNWFYIEYSQPAGNINKLFRIPSNKTMPVVLSPEQLSFLINDKHFEETLPCRLQRTKDIFVFGCTVSLRCSDLMHLKHTNLCYHGEQMMLSVITEKTGANVTIPLPDYAREIIKKYKTKRGRYLLPRLSSTNINLQLKELMERADFTQPLPKIMYRRGKPIELKRKNGKTWRLCDHVTAHTMRRTAITTLLMLGVPETIVRKLSGHSGGSKEFYRYVSLVQNYLTKEVKQAHERLVNLAKRESKIIPD